LYGTLASTASIWRILSSTTLNTSPIISVEGWRRLAANSFANAGNGLRCLACACHLPPRPDTDVGLDPIT
jgi:hypothetical protein